MSNRDKKKMENKVDATRLTYIKAMCAIIVNNMEVGK